MGTKKTAKVLALLLSALLLFGLVPIAAEEAEEQNYINEVTFAYTKSAVTLDGAADEADWAKAEKSALDFHFYRTYYSSGSGGSGLPVDNDKYSATLKGLWGMENEQKCLYILVEVQDAIPDFGDKKEGFVFSMDETCSEGTGDVSGISGADANTQKLRISTSKISTDAGKTVDASSKGRVFYHVKVNTDGNGAQTGYTIELKYVLSPAAGEQVKFNFMLEDSCNPVGDTGNKNYYSRYLWSGTTGHNKPAQMGIGKLGSMNDTVVGDTDDVMFSDGTSVVASAKKDADGKVTLPTVEVFGTLVAWKDAEGKLYPVGGKYTVPAGAPVTLTAVVVDYQIESGASMKIADPTAMRFEFTVKANVTSTLGAAYVDKGVILVESDKLTEAIVTDGKVDFAELDAAGIVYETVTLTDMPAAEGATNTGYYAVKENLTDKTKAYSAIGYITVKFADESTAKVTAAYNAANHSRSIKQIAEGAYADRTQTMREEDGVKYMFKVSKDYAIGDFISFSFSPYTKEQLDLLASFKQ